MLVQALQILAPTATTITRIRGAPRGVQGLGGGGGGRGEGGGGKKKRKNKKDKNK